MDSPLVVVVAPVCCSGTKHYPTVHTAKNSLNNDTASLLYGYSTSALAITATATTATVHRRLHRPPGRMLCSRKTLELLFSISSLLGTSCLALQSASPSWWSRKVATVLRFKVTGTSSSVQRRLNYRTRLSTSPAEAEATEEDKYARTYRINLQLAALSTEALRGRQKAAVTGAKALALFADIQMADTVAYNSLLKVLAKVSPASINGIPAVVLAEQNFDQMKQVHEQQLTANAAWYETLKSADGKIVSQEVISTGPPRIRVKPNARTYATMMDAYSRLGTTEAARRCEELLEELNQRWIDNEYDVALEPNLICYNTVLTAWAKSGGGVAAATCLRWLETMPVAPDRITYNTVLHAIARSGWNDAGERAESILKDDMMLFPREHSSTTSPNARSYTTCMDAWGQCGRPAKAHALLKELEDMFHATGEESFKPNEFSYATVIHAYAVSKDSDKAIAAYSVFNDMLAAGIRPNRVTYNSMLNCCATSTTHPELIEMVEALYHQFLQIKHTDGPDHVTFGTVLKACSNLLWKDETFAVAVFQEACERGQVSLGVLWQFRQAVPIDIYRELVRHDQAPRQWRDLPDEWNSNVREERGARRNASNINRC